MGKRKVTVKCEGPLVWFDVDQFPCGGCKREHAACVIECNACDYVVMSGNFHDEAHADTDTLRSPK